ncbi:squalene synthase HpnC [Chitinimonas lacunae]|uniref:Squalene synthase HpnC n=1 Tax=Chitinimonas lacunae TaxID=1963018 RepID=A0ABV8MI96_9NEIS
MSQDYAVDHYENFPVGSLLLPRAMRRPIAIVYRFARSADDFADEGDFPAEERLRRLDGYRAELGRIERGESAETPLFRDLAAEVIHGRGVPLQLFRDLLDAFSQDVVKTRYQDFGELMQYCRRSANPVGRIVLHLAGQASERNLALSDGICAALQLINFWQDVAIDWQKGRVYLPQEDLQRFGVSEDQIAAGNSGGNWWPLMQFEIERARKLLQAGAPLGLQLPGRLGLEIRLTVLGGETILRKLHGERGDMFRHRPKLVATDWPRMLWRALFPRSRS